MTVSAPFLDRQWCARWRSSVEQDPEIAHIGRWCTLDLVLLAEERGKRFGLDSGLITNIESWHEDRPDAVVLDAPTEDWRQFFRAVPPRWHYDLLGMERRVPGFQVIQGRDTLLRQLRPLHRIVELARRNSNDA